MSIIQNIENFNAQLANGIALCKAMYDRPWAGVHAIFVEVKQFTSKTEHYEALSLSLFLVKYSVQTCLWCLLVCSFPFWIITFIHTDTEKGPFTSNCSFSVSPPMHVIIQNFKLHMNKLQKQVSDWIFHKEESERKVLHIYEEQL